MPRKIHPSPDYNIVFLLSYLSDTTFLDLDQEQKSQKHDSPRPVSRTSNTKREQSGSDQHNHSCCNRKLPHPQTQCKISAAAHQECQNTKQHRQHRISKRHRAKGFTHFVVVLHQLKAELPGRSVNQQTVTDTAEQMTQYSNQHQCF